MRDVYVSTFTQAQKHEAILQTLNRMIDGVLFPLFPFAETAQRWDGMPIVYAQDHPDPDALTADPAAELARIGGRVVGTVRNPRIEFAGHPRLMSDTEIDDEEVSALIDAGRISLSTGFYAKGDNHQITGNVIPNHVLVFQESLKDRPKDLGSGFLNKEELHKYYNKVYIKEINGGQTTVDNPEIKPPAGMTAEEIAALGNNVEIEKYLNAMRQKDAEIAQERAVKNDLFTQVKAQEAKLKAYEQMEKDKKWANIERRLPKGMVHGAEAQKTREWFNKDPEGLILHLIDHYEQTNIEALQEQGKQFLNKIVAKQQKETSDLCSGISFEGPGWE